MEQEFRLSGGAWVCAGCGADMHERDSDQAVVMTHQPGCSEVSGAAEPQA